jgi:hypothetical protein
MIRLGLVVPRYGPEILGGAETFARNLAEHLPPDEYEVTVLTTCARDHLSWENEYPPGESRIHGLRVLRFPVDHARRDVKSYQRLTDRINRGEPLTPSDQSAWLEHSAHSPRLYAHLARCGADYDLFLFLPYLFGTTLYGSAIWPAKSVICPCLHDEPYAYLDDVRLMLRSVRGLMFISAPEQAYAIRLRGWSDAGWMSLPPTVNASDRNTAFRSPLSSMPAGSIRTRMSCSSCLFFWPTVRPVETCR